MSRMNFPHELTIDWREEVSMTGELREGRLLHYVTRISDDDMTPCGLQVGNGRYDRFSVNLLHVSEGTAHGYRFTVCEKCTEELRRRIFPFEGFSVTDMMRRMSVQLVKLLGPLNPHISLRSIALDYYPFLGKNGVLRWNIDGVRGEFTAWDIGQAAKLVTENLADLNLSAPAGQIDYRITYKRVEIRELSTGNGNQIRGRLLAGVLSVDIVRNHPRAWKLNLNQSQA